MASHVLDFDLVHECDHANGRDAFGPSHPVRLHDLDHVDGHLYVHPACVFSPGYFYVHLVPSDDVDLFDDHVILNHGRDSGVFV